MTTNGSSSSDGIPRRRVLWRGPAGDMSSSSFLETSPATSSNNNNAETQRQLRQFMSLRGAESEPKPPGRFFPWFRPSHKQKHAATSNGLGVTNVLQPEPPREERRRFSWAADDDDHEHHSSRRSVLRRGSITEHTMKRAAMLKDQQDYEEDEEKKMDTQDETQVQSTCNNKKGHKQIAPECIGTCFHHTWNECPDGDPESILRQVRDFCESAELMEFCTRAGLIEPEFTWSSHMCPTVGLLHFWRNPLYTQFWEACQSHPDQHMAVVFHGTYEENVPHVLKNGLDPKYGRTQAFGTGKYFAKEPGLSTTYCHGGHQMVVYLVLLPEDKDQKWSQRDSDIVVADHVEHQLPIGAVSYQDVDQEIVQKSQQVRICQRDFKNLAVEKEHLAKEERKLCHLEEAKTLEQEAQDAWDHYREMRTDGLRNIHLSRYMDP